MDGRQEHAGAVHLVARTCTGYDPAQHRSAAEQRAEPVPDHRHRSVQSGDDEGPVARTLTTRPNLQVLASRRCYSEGWGAGAVSRRPFFFRLSRASLTFL